MHFCYFVWKPRDKNERQYQQLTKPNNRMDIRRFFAPNGGGKQKTDPSKESKNDKKTNGKKTPPQKTEKKKTPNKGKTSRSLSNERKDKPTNEGKHHKKTEKGRNKSGDAKKVSKPVSDDEVVLIDDEDSRETNLETKQSKSEKGKDKKENNKREDIQKNEQKLQTTKMESKKSEEYKKNNGSASCKSDDNIKMMSEEDEESPIGKKKRKKAVSDDEFEEVKKSENKRRGKKKPRIFDSDSEEEDPVPKKTKKKKEAVIFLDESDDEDRKPKLNTLDAFVMNTPTPKKKETKKKLECKSSISAADFFGGSSIQRKERTPTMKRKSSDRSNNDEDVEMHDDDDFIKTLELIDKQQTKRVKLDTSAIEETVSPTKNKQKPSLAQKLSEKVKTSVVETPDRKLRNGNKKRSPEKLKNPSPLKSPVKVENIVTPTKRKSTPPRKSQRKTPVKVENIVTPTKRNSSPPRKSPRKTQRKTPVKVENIGTPTKRNSTPPRKSQRKTPVKVENIVTPTKRKSTPPRKTPKKTQTKTPTKISSPDGDTPVLQRKASYRNYLHREGPQALGSKEIPEGAENCLEGLIFVLTGVTESIDRDETKSLVEKYGGKVTTSLSKKTNYIVVGRDAGESKLNKAAHFGTKQLDEDGLFDLIKTKPGKKSKYVIQAEEAAQKEKWLEKKASLSAAITETPKPGSSKMSSSSVVSETKHSIGQSDSNNQSESVLLWVDKHKPVSMKSIIGQQGDKSNAKKLYKWLNCWHKNRASGTKPTGKFFNKSDDGSGFKAALLSGPPGIGKTTSATLVCKESGFSYVELNASDTRSKKSLKTEVAESLNNQTLVDYMGSSKQSHTEGQKHCLIMDEVDGMAGNADRGGLQELVQLIKGSKIPVICICNDRNSMKMRTLSNYCFDLRFYKPRLEQIKGAMMSLAFKEGIKITPPAMNEIILAANQDIRQVIHNLSMWSANDKSLTYEQAKLDSNSAKKDMKIGPFDVCRKVFVGGDETAKMTIHDKSNLFFNDYSIAPLFVQENYPTVIPFAARGNIKEHLRLLAKTADSICDGDLTDKLIRKEGVWSLLPMQAMYASVIPGELMRGSFPQMVAFPSWLGKNSSRNKTDRLLAELSMHMRLNISGDKRALAMDYLPVLRTSLTEPLVRDGGDGVTKVIQLMDEYDITKDDFDNIMDVSKWPNSSDPVSKLDTKTKSAFTRTYNKESHMTPYATAAAPKKKRGGKGTVDEDGDELLRMEGEDDEDGTRADSEEEEGLETDTMIKAKKAPAKTKAKKETTMEKTTTTTTTKGKGKGKGKGKS